MSKSAHPSTRGQVPLSLGGRQTARREAGRKARRPCRHKDKSPRHAATSARKPVFHSPWKQPSHVRNCWNNGRNKELGADQQDWWIWSWPVGNPEKKVRRPYCCGSWRCGGKCATHAAHKLFARLEAATAREQYDPGGWVFVVLTLDRLGTRGGQKWTSLREAYRSLGQMSERYLKRLRRLCERKGWEAFGSEWVMVVEAHRNNWPHANLMVYCPELAAELQEETEARELAGFRGRELVVFAHQHELLGNGIRGELGKHAVATGWGIESTAEKSRSREALAGYMVKLAARPDQTLGEIAKLTQLPHAAPFRFRRLRSGKGFLPPETKNEAYTGALVKRTLDQKGIKWSEVPEPKRGHAPERVKCVQLVEKIEDEILRIEEKAAWARMHGRRRRDSPVPPVSLWMGEVLQRQQGPPLAKVKTWDEARAAAWHLQQQEIRIATY